MRGTVQVYLRVPFLAAIALSGLVSLFSQTAPPPAHVGNTVDDYYGTKVADPYRWMEAGAQDPQFTDFMKAQNDYTRAVLASLPGRQKLLARMIELDGSTSARVGDVWRFPGDLYFYQKKLPTEDVFKLYLRKGLNGQEKLLVDPERITIAEANRGKGKSTIAYYWVSNDAGYVAVGILPGGSENDIEIHVIEIASAHETGDVIHRARDFGGLHWLPDNHSFVYGRLQTLSLGAPATEVEQKYRSYLHVLGRDPDKDPAVFGYGVVPSINVDPRHFATIRTRADSNFALGVIDTGVSPNEAFYIAPVNAIGKSNVAWRKVADFSDDVSDIAIHGDDLYLLTFKNTLRYKIIRTRAANPDLGSAETIVPPGQAVVTGMTAAEGALYVRLMDGGVSRILRVAYGAKPKVESVSLPFEGNAYPSSDPGMRGTLLYMGSWTKAFKIYAYDPETEQVTDTGLQPAGPYDDPANLESIEVKVPSIDGTLVPLSIVHAKGMKLDGSNPTLLTGYGSYGIPQNPYFDRTFLAWYEKGGVYAFCHPRGGGEYGEEWHLAGKGATKPNTWRDFIACAEYLIDKKYTSPVHLSGEGTSAGGILIGRAITERPDLFGAAIIGYGWSDMLRTETTANGVPNIAEFGSTKTEDGFKALYAMSAYHHVKDQTPYPAILLTTGMNDPRVDPWQSAKMTARLEAATTSSKPVLLRVDYAGGHGDSTIKQVLERAADDWSFLLWQSGVPEFQPQR